MTTNAASNEVTQQKEKQAGSGLRGKGVRFILCLLIIAIGVVGANYLTSSAPKTRRRPVVKMTPLVRVIPVYPATHSVMIQAMGTVIPARELVLKSRVSGEVVATHPDFSQGGFLKKRTKILQIDDADYQLALAQNQSALVNARYALKLEQGRQEVAKREWGLLNGNKEAVEEDNELALRRPHLEKVRADLKAAEASLQQSKLDLDRTRIYAPFNAIIRATHVEVGSQVAPQNSLAELVGTDEYWIQVSIPVDRLQWITIPSSHKEEGAAARILYRTGAACTGKVTKLLADLEPDGRMARLLVSVKNPLGLKKPHDHQPPLLIGEYVRVDIKGKQINGVYRIPRTALRDNTHIWIVGEDNTLQVRNVETLWRDADTVLLKKGLQPGERLIVSDLSTPIGGMALRIEDMDAQVQPSVAAPQSPNQG